MKKTIVSNFWLPEDVIQYAGGDFELVYPQEEISGHFGRDELLARLGEVDGVFVDLMPFDRQLIDAGGRRLKVIGRLGVGCDSVDCVYAGSKGIAVINTPQAVTEPTAELALTLLLDAARNISRLDRLVRREGRCSSPALFLGGSSTVMGKTLGIVGLGRIGSALARKARGLGMRIVYASPRPASPDVCAALQAEWLPLETLLARADFVSLNCPYRPENLHLINEKTLALMKKSAFLINAARGKLVDEAALARAIKNGDICGAALDVFEDEPAIAKELLALDRVVLAPHIGTWCYDTRVAMAKEALDGMRAYLAGGSPPNVFNKDSLRLS
ncbi:MAG: hydroxyacid dehydrogenase [Spirochaetaceae bacterium]|nr:hydroxyacid dehydrogenase [Spirochaetaceae bacterium]